MRVMKKLQNYDINRVEKQHCRNDLMHLAPSEHLQGNGAWNLALYPSIHHINTV